LNATTLAFNQPPSGEAPDRAGDRAAGNYLFQVYKSQLPVIERAFETAGLMLGNDKSRGYCLEMICEDFLAGANVKNGEVKSLTATCLHESGLLPDVKTNS
jgi:hypothetical protein